MSAKKKPDSTKISNKTPEITAKQSPAVTPPQQDFFDRLGNKTVLLVSGLLFLILFFIFKDFLFFDKAYLFKDIGSDSSNLCYPFLIHDAEYIAKYGLPKWSFSLGMGQSFFPFFLRDPFDIFLYLGGKDHIIYGIIILETVKIMLIGITTYYYLKTLKLSEYTATAGSILLAFCGFVMVGSGWYIFTFEVWNIMLLLLAYEQLMAKQRWYLFPFAIFLVCISMPFNLYVDGLLLAFYSVFRQFQTNTFSVKNTGLAFAKMAGLGFIGMLLSAPFLIENIVQILESPRGSGTNSYAHILSSMPMFDTPDRLEFGTGMLRFFSNDILGTGNEFKGWQNYLEAPLFYSGIACLVLMPQVFQFLDKRRKIAFGVFLAIWLLPVIFPYFRRAFWLFSGDYYRGYSFWVGFVILFYALHALDQIIKYRKINLPVLIATVIGLFMILYYPYFEGGIVNSPVLTFVSFMLLVYAALLYFMSRQDSTPYLKYIFLFAVVVELIYQEGTSVNDRQAISATELSERKGYNDYSIEAIKNIQQHDASFYRIDKTYASSLAMHYSLNDAMVQGYNGTSRYDPFNQVYYIKYLQLMGISNKANELESRWANGLAFRPLLESQNRVKYILAKTNINPLWQVVCDQVGTFGDVKVFRNKFVLPVGFTYDTYIRESVFEPLNTVQKDFISLSACVIKDEDVSKVQGLKEFQLKDTIVATAFTIDLYGNKVKDLSRDTLVLSNFDNKLISGKINASENKMMYLTVPYDGGWQLKVDGQPREKMILDGGITGIMLSRGQHTIEMTYDLRFFRKGLLLSILGILLCAGLWFFTKKKNNKEAVAA